MDDVPLAVVEDVGVFKNDFVTDPEVVPEDVGDDEEEGVGKNDFEVVPEFVPEVVPEDVGVFK